MRYHYLVLGRWPFYYIPEMATAAELIIDHCLVRALHRGDWEAMFRLSTCAYNLVDRFVCTTPSVRSISMRNLLICSLSFKTIMHPFAIA